MMEMRGEEGKKTPKKRWIIFMNNFYDVTWLILNYFLPLHKSVKFVRTVFPIFLIPIHFLINNIILLFMHCVAMGPNKKLFI